MALTNNPNKTKTLEKRWRAEINRRYAQLKAEMLLIPVPTMITNVDTVTQSVIDDFLALFNRRAIGILLSTPWQNKYQTIAYERSIERVSQGIRSLLTGREAFALPSLDLGAAALVTTTEHSNELNFLHSRANGSLAKWVNQLLEDTKSILHEKAGIVPADSIYDAILDRINVTASRSRVIDTTEISQASQRSVIKEVQETAIVSDQNVEVRWITVADPSVRHLHANWHGKIMSPEQAARNITISPWNCRCGLKPVIKNRVPARVNARFAKERKILLAKEKNSVA